MTRMKPSLTSNQIDASTAFIRTQTLLKPSIAIVLGSGLGDFAEQLEDQVAIRTSTIPFYPRSTVHGHEGKIVFGKLGRVPLLVFQGRVHLYETGQLETILYPVRIAKALGIKTLIMTNAAGGINNKFSPADLMLITDQINLTFQKPLEDLALGPPERLKPFSRARITDFGLYDEKLQRVITNVAKKGKIALRRGVYCGVEGPSYETAAEIRMIRTIGGDAVGMSTVNEVSLASRLGIKVAGISCITNLSTGMSASRLSHKEVTEVASKVKRKFSSLIGEVVRLVHLSPNSKVKKKNAN